MLNNVKKKGQVICFCHSCNHFTRGHSSSQGVYILERQTKKKEGGGVFQKRHTKFGQ